MKTSRRPKYAVRLEGKERRLWVQPAAEIYDDGKTFGLRVFVGDRKVLDLKKLPHRVTAGEVLEEMLPRETWDEDSLLVLDQILGRFYVGQRLGAIPMPRPVSNKQLQFDLSVSGGSAGGAANGTFYEWLQELLAWRKNAAQQIRSQMLISLNEEPKFSGMISNVTHEVSGMSFWDRADRDGPRFMSYAKQIREMPDPPGMTVSKRSRQEIAVVLEELGAKIAWAGGVHDAEHRVREERLQKLVAGK